MVNWSKLITTNQPSVKQFAVGNMSGRSFYSAFSGTNAGGEARELLRSNGVTYARRLARKALRRRNVLS